MAYFWMLLGSILFAAMGILTESLGGEFGFAWIALIRSGIATLIAVSLALAAGAKLVVFRPKSLWMRSLSGSGAMLCLFFAMTHYDVAVVLSLSSTYPIWVALLEWPLLGSLPSRNTWIALAVSLLGMLLVYSSAIGEERLVEHPQYVPQLAIPAAVLAGLLSGIALIGLHKVKEVDSRSVVAHFSGVSTFLSALVWVALPITPLPYSTDATSWVRLIGVGVTALLGQLFLTKAFAAGPPARVSVVGLSQVAFAGIYKWIVDSRIPSEASMLGMALVIGATLWVLLQPKK